MPAANGLAPVILTPEVVRHVHGSAARCSARRERARARKRWSTRCSASRSTCCSRSAATARCGLPRSSCASSRAAARDRRSSRCPKTIDDDIAFVDKTFGFDTAVEHARAAIDAAHAEALSARNGIGLVKLMGRDAGFIAAHATIASAEVELLPRPRGAVRARRRRAGCSPHSSAGSRRAVTPSSSSPRAAASTWRRRMPSAIRRATCATRARSLDVGRAPVATR